MNLKTKHTFCVCAYKESPYLEECVRSLLRQSAKSRILIATSTPNPHIESIAEKYHIPLYVNEGEHGIVQDWNFAYSKADTPYVTIAHQDDLYFPSYAQRIVEKLERSDMPLIAFSGYCELRGGQMVKGNPLLRIKRFLLSPMRVPALSGRRFWKRAVLSLGNSICCPSVTFVRERLPEVVFTPGFQSNMDWESWERFSLLDGSFVYEPASLMCHRIHEDSTTSEIIGNHLRTREDTAMFEKFWHPGFARILAGIYASCEKSNQI